MKKGIGLAPHLVRWAKEQLMAGATQAAVARALHVSTNTIGRMARGETHQGVRVAGEEALRPWEPLTAPGEAVPMNRGIQPIGREPTAQELAESEARLMRLLNPEEVEMEIIDPILQGVFKR